MRSMIDSTDAFEAWMRKRTDVSRKLLKKKHRKMCKGPFPFLLTPAEKPESRVEETGEKEPHR